MDLVASTGYEHARNETKGGTKETKYIQAHEERLGNIFRECKYVHFYVHNIITP